jgi:hypothetical protein
MHLDDLIVGLTERNKTPLVFDRFREERSRSSIFVKSEEKPHSITSITSSQHHNSIKDPLQLCE